MMNLKLLKNFKMLNFWRRVLFAMMTSPFHCFIHQKQNNWYVSCVVTGVWVTKPLCLSAIFSHFRDFYVISYFIYNDLLTVSGLKNSADHKDTYVLIVILWVAYMCLKIWNVMLNVFDSLLIHMFHIHMYCIQSRNSTSHENADIIYQMSIMCTCLPKFIPWYNLNG